MAEERVYIENNFIPLTQSLNPSITKSITDLTEPQNRKSTYTKTVTFPDSKEARRIFKHYFEFNGVDSYATETKADVRYECDSETILSGYIRLNKVREVQTNNFEFDCTMFSELGNFFTDIKDAYMVELYESTTDYEGLDIYDHQLTKEIQQLSWEDEIIINGSLEPFDYGKGYVYALVDFGFSQDATNFIFTQIGTSIYELEYMLRIIKWAGYTLKTGGFFDTDTIFKHLIIPASPECYQLNSTDIEDREFAANTPEFTSTGTTASGNLPIGMYSADDVIVFTNDSVSPAFDPNGNYNPTTGEFTVVETGTYNLTTLIDINATFTPGTGTAVKTTCDIQGFVMMFLNGTQIDALPFYITSDDSSFTVGARSTSTTPTYPDSDYMIGKAWGKLTPSSPVARPSNPPDRYQLTITGVPLQTGDVITIQWKAGIFARSSTPFVYTPSSDLFKDALSIYHTGDATISVVVGSFYDKVSNLMLTEGNTLTIDKVIPQQVKMIDYFLTNVRRFNLIVDVNQFNPKELIIETRDSFYTSTVKNIHELIDRDKPIESIPVSSQDIKQYLYKLKPDKDYWNERYTRSWQETYGDRKVDVINEFTGAQKKTELIFSPTCMVGLPQNDRVLPTIYALNDYNQPITTKFNTRSLYYAGLKPCLNAWNHINYVSVFAIPFPTTYVTYPYAGHFDDPFDPTFDLNFGLVKEVFYDDDLNPIEIIDNNVVNKYHGTQLRELTDPDSRIVKCHVHLRPLDYVNFTFDKLYYWDYAYFRLQEISDYNPTSEESTACTFLKLVTIPRFTATSHTATGNPLSIEPDQSGGNVNMAEVTPAKGTRSSEQPDNNNYSSRSVTVSGENNYVSGKAKNVEIYGNSNAVWAEAKNIKIQGSNNIINAGVENVTLINTIGITVNESDAVYINGLKGDINDNGTYTPVASSATNLDATPTPGPANFLKVGNLVVVSGYFDADPTTTLVATDFELSLPIPSTIANLEDVAGVASSGNAPGETIQIFGGVANGTAYFSWVAVSVANNRWSYIYQYRIL